MNYSPVRLHRLILLGPDKEPAQIEFSPGLNVVRGASDTGKSFIVSAIDYMLGGKAPLKHITESEGYDRLLLTLYSIPRKQFYTLVRGVQGGDFELFLGDHQARPADTPHQILKPSPQSSANISNFLLELVDLNNRRVMKNKAGDTERLGFRNLVHLCLINETRIQSETPPALSEQVIQQTKSKQVLKLILTSLDDSAVVSTSILTTSKTKADAQIEIIDELISELQSEIAEDGRQAEELMAQLGNIERTIAELRDAIGVTEDLFGRLRIERQDLRSRYDASDQRRGEIASLNKRLEFLDQHYVTDIRRLEAIAEASQIYHFSATEDCQLCGADPEHQKKHANGEQEVRETAVAAEAEVHKIRRLRSELAQTLDALVRENFKLTHELPLLVGRLEGIDGNLKEREPSLQADRERYVDTLDVRSSIGLALDRYGRLGKLIERRGTLGVPAVDPEARFRNEIDPGLSEQTLYSFSRTIEYLLSQWEYPEPRTVSLREKDLELIVGGKPRSASGKGVRALLHSAFSLGLLQHARALGLRHPGFVILDSPLLTYAPPEDGERRSADDERIAQSHLKENFFTPFIDWPDDMQALIIENVPIPQWVLDRPSTAVFTGSKQSGRYGYIPT